MLITQTGCQTTGSHPNAMPLHWTKLPPVPDREGFAGGFAGVSNDALIFAGGANIKGDKWGSSFDKVWYDSVFVLEQPDGPWQTGFKLPHPLGYGVSVTTENGIVCIGGSDANRHYPDVFRLVWHQGKLECIPMPALPKPCANFCGTIIDHTIYVAGGTETPTATEALKTFWKLDLSAKKPHWEELEPWPGPARMLAVAGASGGSFYLFSGAHLKAGPTGKPVREYLQDAYRFTPGKGWQRLTDLPHPVVAAPSPAIGTDHLLVLSGDDGTKVDFQPLTEHPGFSREVLAFDIKNGTWSIPGEVPFSRATAPAVQWRGHIVVLNGELRPRERTPEVWWTNISRTDKDVK
ncbi:galactose oxidase [Pedosphaera parvula]|nr:galactose oxidase [Pedosphaera parvula]